jgi:3-methyladenine DNA glycosylase Tag
MSELEDLMKHIEEELEDIWENVQTVRDEAKLQAHLAKAEVKDELESLEHKFDEYSGKMKLVKEEVARENEEIFDAARKLGKELLNSYQKIKGLLNK